MPKTRSLNVSSRAKAYEALLNNIHQEIASGLRVIEHQKIKTYWNVGRVINRFLSGRENPPGSIGAFYQQLSQDIDIGVRTLQQCEQFFRYFPKLSPRPGMSWSHYRYLLRLPDAKERQRWLKRVESQHLTTNELRFSLADSAPSGTGTRLIEPARGVLYAYRIVRDDVAGDGAAGWMVDCGFTNRITAPVHDGTLHNRYVYTSVKDGNGYRLHVTDLTADNLYTFRAKLLRVVDGDTLLVRIDQGFGVWTDQRLRLKGIDAAELASFAGKKAKFELENYLGKAPSLVVRTHKTDKYDRYLADVFVGKAGDDPHQAGACGVYLNQWLIDSGLAGVYQGK